ncbi:MAG: hypothetical protein K6E75_01455 [Lachnospiraceae bacterium]|nr:hypothetical protein [Lachnospiraceae bacterium]
MPAPEKLSQKLKDGDAINRMSSLRKKMTEQEDIQKKKQQVKTNLLKK